MGEVPFLGRLLLFIPLLFQLFYNNLYLNMINTLWQQDIDLDQDLDHYDMKEEEPVDGKKSEDDGIEKENLAILEKIRKNQRQDHLNVSAY